MEEHGDYYELRNYDERHKWMFMTGPMPIVCIVIAYLVFVLKVGPDFMTKREPYNLQPVLVIYNLFLTIYSICVLLSYGTYGVFSYWYTNGLCKAEIVDKYLVHGGATISWYYLVAKIVELADTVFFVLRKKQQQVTFLHVYHHSAIIFFVWGIAKYYQSDQGFIAILLNSIVHVVMYIYYMLSAMGPKYQKYIWWKKYLTVLQLAQFTTIITYASYLLLLDCKHPKGISAALLAFNAFFWFLFAKFYYNAYMKKAKA